MQRIIAGVAGGETVGVFMWTYMDAQMNEAARRCAAVAHVADLVGGGMRSAAFDDRACQFFVPDSRAEWESAHAAVDGPYWEMWEWRHTQDKAKGRMGVLVAERRGPSLPPCERVDLQFPRMTCYRDGTVRFGGWLRGTYVVSDKIQTARNSPAADGEL